MQPTTTPDQEIHTPTQQPMYLHDPVFFGTTPGDERASCAGAATLEILEVVRLSERSGVRCCVVGISALIYFGAGRVRNLWSLLHTFPRFKIHHKSLCFIIIPAEDAHLDFNILNIERSRMDIPYPALETFTQSLLDTNNLVSLTDLVDGMDLTEEWGLQHLRLEGENDVLWAENKNEKIRDSVPETPDSCLLELSTTPMSLKETWQNIVKRKDGRIGMECPKEVFATRFRVRGDGDMRLGDRDEA